VLPVGLCGFARKILVGSQDRLQCVEDVLACFLTGSALADSSGHLEHTRDDPTSLVRAVERDRKVD
jgi:hypothetical protein